MQEPALDIKRPRDDSPLANETKKPRLEDHSDEPNPASSTIPPESIPEAPIPTPSAAPTPATIESQLTRPAYHDDPPPVSRLGLKPVMANLPPSLEIVTGIKTDLRARKGFVGQDDVGIIGYAGPSEFKGVKGVIKQR